MTHVKLHFKIELSALNSFLHSNQVSRTSCIAMFLKRWRNFQLPSLTTVAESKAEEDWWRAKLDSWSLPTGRHPSVSLVTIQPIVIELVHHQDWGPVIPLSWPETKAPPISALEVVIISLSVMPSQMAAPMYRTSCWVVLGQARKALGCLSLQNEWRYSKTEFFIDSFTPQEMITS